MKKKKSLIIKVIIGLTLLSLIILKIDLETFKTVVSNFTISNFILITFLYIIGQILSSYKWGIITDQLGFKCSLYDYIIYYFKGMFYNQFLPTSIGGDVMKVIYLKKHKEQKPKIEPAVISVLFDRISGVLILLLLLIFGVVLCFKELDKLAFYIIAGIIFGIICTLGIIILTKLNIKTENKIINKITLYTNTFLNKSLIKVVFVSIIFHLIVILIHILIGQDLSLNIPLKYYLILYPMSAIIASIPLSINGLGLREFAYVYLLGIISLNASQCVVFVLYWNCMVIVSSLIGALAFLKKTEVKKELND